MLYLTDMAKKPFPVVELTLDRIIGGGQTIGTLEDGKKCLVWNGLPGETVKVQITKKKSSFNEGVVTEVIKPAAERIEPRDPDSYLSTSPWQIMSLDTENRHKEQLISEFFDLHNVKLPDPISVWSDGVEYGYRNKVEYSFWYDTDKETLDLAFFRRGTHGKISVKQTSLASDAINTSAKIVLEALRTLKIDGRSLKTLLIRSSQSGKIAWQLYVKDKDFNATGVLDTVEDPDLICGEVIYSNPKSPASVITERLAATSDEVLTDKIGRLDFNYATEGFFQINLPVYEKALSDIEEAVGEKLYNTPPPGVDSMQVPREVIDLYSGVGTIGLLVGASKLVEINEFAVREMERNISDNHLNAEAILAASEDALEYISDDNIVIVDPPRAGLHDKVVQKLLDTRVKRIVYLSCNPATQARDVMMLQSKYEISSNKGYNFFPHTPHIENLVVLDRK